MRQPGQGTRGSRGARSRLLPLGPGTRGSRGRRSPGERLQVFAFFDSFLLQTSAPPGFSDETLIMDFAPCKIRPLPFSPNLLSHNAAFTRRERDRIHENRLGFTASGFNRKTTIKILAIVLPNTSHTALSLCLFGSVSVRQHSSRGGAGSTTVTSTALRLEGRPAGPEF